MSESNDAHATPSDDAALGVPSSADAGEGEEEAWGEEELWGEADEADGEEEAAAAAASAPPLPAGNGPAAGSSEPHAHVVYPIRVEYLGGRFLVWEPREIYALRVDHRLVGSLGSSRFTLFRDVVLIFRDDILFRMSSASAFTPKRAMYSRFR